MTISQMFKVLERKGYIYRTPHPSDVRSKAVFLSETGIELMNVAVPMVEKIDDIFFNALGKNMLRFNQCMVELVETNE
jgi:DNA-binding MarR family transcriptional regulator